MAEQRRRGRFATSALLVGSGLVIGAGCGGGSESAGEDHVAVCRGWAVLPSWAESSAEGKLIGPHFDLEIGVIATGDSYDEIFEDRPPDDGQAAEGHELLLASVTNLLGPDDPEPPADGPVLDVVVDDRSTRLDSLPAPGSAMLVVVSVPEGGHPTLGVEDEDRTQSIDLRTAERIEQIDGFYTPRVRQDLDDTYTGTLDLPSNAFDRATGAPVPVAQRLTLAFHAAERIPWSAPKGYAAEHRAWLEITVGDLEQIRTSPEPGGLQPRCSPVGRPLTRALISDTSFLLTDASGQEILPEPGLVGRADETGPLVFEVPADFTTGTLRMSPGTGPLVTYGNNGNGDFIPLENDPCQWQTPATTLDIPIQLTETTD